MSDYYDVAKLDPSIVLDIRYATTNNFTGKVLYTSPKCFLRKKVALKLLPVQEKLRRMGLGLKIFDGYRPPQAAQAMWDTYPDSRFVANPKVGSKHTRGAAIDMTLVDLQGKELTMPTEFDSFTERAYRACMDLPEHAMAHRQLLENVMKEGGFIPLPSEWWHFDDEEWEKYPLDTRSFEELEQICNV